MSKTLEEKHLIYVRTQALRDRFVKAPDSQGVTFDLKEKIMFKSDDPENEEFRKSIKRLIVKSNESKSRLIGKIDEFS